ncbi:IS3 family transposase, partial [Paracoccus yeei]|uniref:IS3 family transposase n=1 Tax=Paracoccus yeei TaxID=147645 RepID=UPI0021AE2B7A
YSPVNPGRFILLNSQPKICATGADGRHLKAELVWRREWHTRRDVEIALFEYINGFYNPRRKHSALGWKSPVAFEQRAA